MNFFTIKVLLKRIITPSACLIHLDVPDEFLHKFKYLAGQYITIQITDNKGVIQKRCYSLCGNLAKNEIAFCVKKVEGGFVSNYLFNELQAGDKLSISSADGNFTLENSKAITYSNTVFISAGSGITPIKSLIESLLQKKYQGKIYLLFGNNNIKEIIFIDYFKQIEKEYENVKIIHILKNTPLKWSGEQGRLITENISKLFTEHSLPLEDTAFFVSGPQGIIDNSFEYLTKKGVLSKNFFSEKFFTSLPENINSNKKFKASVISEGLLHQIDFTGNKSLLDASLENGINANHSCRIGTCLSCTATLKSGNIHIQNDGELTDEQKKNNIILTCQSFALDNNVEIDYDTEVKKDLLHSRNKLIGLAFFIGLIILCFFIFYPKSEVYLKKGAYNIGHQDLECIHCHQDAKGSLRQQAQYNVKNLFSSEKTLVDFGKKPVGNNACIHCHNRPNDQHPVHRFLEPKFKEAREDIHPELCVSCHAEHSQKRVTLQQTDYCVSCHKEVEIVNDPLDIKHDKLIQLELWNTCIQCHDFHGNHVMEVATQLKDTIPLKEIKEYFEEGKDPYSDIKKYISNLDSINKNPQ